MKKLILATVAIFALVGCGGGGGSIPDKLSINTDAKAIAYKNSGDDWKSIDINSGTITSDGLKHYELDKMDKFMVALNCKQGSHESIYIVGYAKEDGNIKLKCPKMSVSLVYGVKGDLSDSVTANPSAFAVAIGTDWHIDNSAPFKYSLSTTNGIHDLLITSFDASSEPARFYLERGLNVNTNIVKNINLTTSNSCAIKNKAFTGNESSFRVVLVTKNDTYFTSSNGGKWYYPDCTLDSEDNYVLVGKNAPNDTVRIETFPTSQAKTDITGKTVSHIKKLTQLQYQAAGQITGLSHYTPSSKSPKLIGYITELKNSSNNYYRLLLSKKFLGDDDVFDFPNITSVSGFSSVWDGKNASSGKAMAVMSDHNWQDILFSPKKLQLDEAKFFMLKKGVIELAHAH